MGGREARRSRGRQGITRVEGEGRPGGVLGLTGGEGKRKECSWPGGAEARVQVPRGHP